MPTTTIESVIEQTHELISWLPGAEPTTAVPTCPGWVLRDLIEHVGATQRWVTRLIADQAADPAAAFAIGWEKLPDSPALWEQWLTDGVAGVVAAIDGAPSDAAVFDPSFGGDGVRFWSTRLFGEISVHRIDAATTIGREYVLAPELAGLAVDDWLGTISSAGWAANVPGFAEAMRGSGQTITWVAHDIDRAWVVRRTDAPLELTSTSAQDAGADDHTATVESDAVTLLQLVSRRRPLSEAEQSSVRGDRAELQHLVDHMNWVGAG